MDKEFKLATTTDQFYHDDKLSDQYVVQRPSARACRRKDEFIWMKPPLARQHTADPQWEEQKRGMECTSFQDNKPLKAGGWPRPPVNYCILIALALKSSHTGCLKVQQIYNFTREHFPFFQTAPDGWKNTIRHNLCFNSSFCKTCNQMSKDGKRKSCFWHLTRDGQRRLKEEFSMLTKKSLKQLEGSMSCPDIIGRLLAM
nr:forkhead box protein N5-like isoform X2 [Nerophis lumbriciformis]